MLPENAAGKCCRFISFPQQSLTGHLNQFHYSRLILFNFEFLLISHLYLDFRGDYVNLVPAFHAKVPQVIFCLSVVTTCSTHLIPPFKVRYFLIMTHCGLVLKLRRSAELKRIVSRQAPSHHEPNETYRRVRTERFQMPTYSLFSTPFLYLRFKYYLQISCLSTASVIQWSAFLAANPEVPGSILDATRFPE
jgi:hypothetical protein